MLDDLDAFSDTERAAHQQQCRQLLLDRQRKLQDTMAKQTKALDTKSKYWVYFESTRRWVPATKIGYDLAFTLGRPTIRSSRRPSYHPKKGNFDVSG